MLRYAKQPRVEGPLTVARFLRTVTIQALAIKVMSRWLGVLRVRQPNSEPWRLRSGWTRGSLGIVLHKWQSFLQVLI